MAIKTPKEKLHEKLKNWIGNKPLLEKSLMKIALPSWNEKNTNKFFEEVKNHIKSLREFRAEYGNPNEIILQKMNDYDLKVWQRNYLKRRYSKEYCPAAGFPFGFSQSEKISYILLRSEIDRLLNIKNVKYTI